MNNREITQQSIDASETHRLCEELKLARKEVADLKAHGYAVTIYDCPKCGFTRTAKGCMKCERDEARVACEKYKQAMSEGGAYRQTLSEAKMEIDSLRRRLEAEMNSRFEAVAAMNRANEATTREEQRALAAEAKLAAVKEWKEKIHTEDNDPIAILTLLLANLEDLYTIISDTRPPLAVVEACIYDGERANFILVNDAPIEVGGASGHATVIVMPGGE